MRPILLKMKTKEQLEQNWQLFQDYNGDYWYCMADYELWEKNDMDNICNCCHENICGEIIDFYDYYSYDMDVGMLDWCVEKILTKETDPEYFL